VCTFDRRREIERFTLAFGLRASETLEYTIPNG
jgi:hypothetical protein